VFATLAATVWTRVSWTITLDSSDAPLDLTVTRGAGDALPVVRTAPCNVGPELRIPVRLSVDIGEGDLSEVTDGYLFAAGDEPEQIRFGWFYSEVALSGSMAAASDSLIGESDQELAWFLGVWDTWAEPAMSVESWSVGPSGHAAIGPGAWHGRAVAD
jgi:hypothetical protein